MMDENFEVNYIRYIGLIIIILLFIYAFFPFNLFFPPIEPEVKTIIQKEFVYITVIPTPDYITTFSNEYESGIRKINHPFSWIRYNVSGLKTLKVTTNVYNYLMFDSIHWFNPTDYKYYTVYPEIFNSKFLFIMVNVYMDDIIGDDSRMWLVNKTSFNVQINDKIYTAKEYPEQLRIKELEYTHNLNDDSLIQPFGVKRIYSRSSLYSNTAGETISRDYYLRGGISNAVDGYLIFEIPKNTEPEDIMINGRFFEFGSSSWVIKK